MARPEATLRFRSPRSKTKAYTRKQRHRDLLKRKREEREAVKAEAKRQRRERRMNRRVNAALRGCADA